MSSLLRDSSLLFLFVLSHMIMYPRKTGDTAPIRRVGVVESWGRSPRGSRINGDETTPAMQCNGAFSSTEVRRFPLCSVSRAVEFLSQADTVRSCTISIVCWRLNDEETPKEERNPTVTRGNACWYKDWPPISSREHAHSMRSYLSLPPSPSLT